MSARRGERDGTIVIASQRCQGFGAAGPTRQDLDLTLFMARCPWERGGKNSQ